MLAALATSVNRTITILREVARIVRRTATAVTARAALATGFDRTIPIMREIAGASLSSNTTGARRFLAIEREVATIGYGSRLRHGLDSLSLPHA